MEGLYPKRPIQEKEHGNGWKWVLFLLWLVVYGCCHYRTQTSWAKPLDLLWQHFLLAFIVWGVFYFSSARKLGSKVARISLAALLFAAILGFSSGFTHRREETDKAMTEMKKEFNAFFKSSVDKEGFPKKIDKHIDTTPKSMGEFGEFERFVKEMLNGLADQRNSYLEELKRIGWEKLLDAGRLKSDPSLSQSRQMIQEAKDAIANQKIKQDIFLKQTRAKLAEINVEESAKAKIIKGFDSGLSQSRKQLEESWDLEQKIVLEAEEIINMLAEKRGSWVLEKDTLIFSKQAELDNYNAHLAAINAISAKQIEIQKKGIDRFNKEFEK
jgi:hypothetical protein